MTRRTIRSRTINVAVAESRLQFLRMTREQFARHCGLHPETVCAAMRGQPILLTSAVLMARGLGVSMVTLVLA